MTGYAATAHNGYSSCASFDAAASCAHICLSLDTALLVVSIFIVLVRILCSII